MGHGVGAALTASLCLGSLRGGRRSGATLLEQAAETTRRWLNTQPPAPRDFVTGLLARVDLRTGWLRDGQRRPRPPYLARGTEVRRWTYRRTFPFGCSPTPATAAPGSPCVRGDRVVLVTDGMLERNVGAVDLLEAIADSQGASSARGRSCAGRQRPRGHRPPAQRRRHHSVSGLAREPRPGTIRRSRGRPRSRQRPTRLTTTSTWADRTGLRQRGTSTLPVPLGRPGSDVQVVRDRDGSLVWQVRRGPGRCRTPPRPSCRRQRAQ